jgi:hypothetical protein
MQLEPMIYQPLIGEGEFRPDGSPYFVELIELCADDTRQPPAIIG